MSRISKGLIRKTARELRFSWCFGHIMFWMRLAGTRIWGARHCDNDKKWWGNEFVLIIRRLFVEKDVCFVEKDVCFVERLDH